MGDDIHQLVQSTARLRCRVAVSASESPRSSQGTGSEMHTLPYLSGCASRIHPAQSCTFAYKCLRLKSSAPRERQEPWKVWEHRTPLGNTAYGFKYTCLLRFQEIQCTKLVNLGSWIINTKVVLLNHKFLASPLPKPLPQ